MLVTRARFTRTSSLNVDIDQPNSVIIFPPDELLHFAGFLNSNILFFKSMKYNVVEIGNPCSIYTKRYTVNILEFCKGIVY